MKYEKTALLFVFVGTILVGVARGVFDAALHQAGLDVPLLSKIFYWIVVAYVTASVFALFSAAPGPGEKGRSTAIIVTCVYIALCVQSFFTFSVISPFLLLGYMLSTPVANFIFY